MSTRRKSKRPPKISWPKYPPLTSVDELMAALAQSLNLPGWFGRNWDALRDLITTLFWLTAKRVHFIHIDLPNIPPQDLFYYLGVLEEGAYYWNELSTELGDFGPNHELLVWFPHELRTSTASVLSTGQR